MQKEANSVNLFQYRPSIYAFVKCSVLISTGTQKEYPEVYRSSPQYPQANLKIVPSISMMLTIHILLVVGCE